jgi:multiple sugar transport system substrate-binding protein
MARRQPRSGAEKLGRDVNNGRIAVIRKIVSTALLSTALMTVAVGGAMAKDTIIWWDFLGGGDGVRMKALIDQFNKESTDLEIQATTLDWGTPFYTKVQTSAAVGEGPDIMTYHESRIPLGVSTGSLSEITPDEIKAAGLDAANYAPANWAAAQVDGKQYAIPLDIHSIILYYNKDMFKAAGLLGDDGKPKGLDGAANFDAALKKLTANGVSGLALPNDGGTAWRVFYTLLNQDNGKFLTDDGKTFLDGDNLQKATDVLTEMQGWVKNGVTPANTEYPAAIALFTSGKAATMINGVWEVPTMVDLQKQGKLFDWGAVQIPVFYDHAATWADSHSFAIPDRKGNPVSPDKRKEVLSIIKWFNEHSLAWAGGGHVPAFIPVTSSDDFKNLKPNSDYSSLAATAVFDPVSTLAGVASPVYDAAGNYIVPVIQGEMAPGDGAQQMKDDLQGQVQ